MADREKTVKGLEIHADRSDKTDCDDCPYIRYKGDCIGQLCSDALVLLKELEVKTVLYIEKRLVIQVKAMSGFCPKCSHTLIYGMNKHFCGNCGQAVKWDA